MRRPDFYPAHPERVELRETHISWVFLAGDRVYKVKKPLTLPFLDYGSRERRRLMCHEEVRLDSRLAPGVYLGVVSIVRTPAGFALAAPEREDAVDYAVEMRRLPEQRTLARLLSGGGTPAGAIPAVARRLADFHRRAEQSPAGFGGPRSVRAALDETSETLLELGPAVPAAEVRALARALDGFAWERRTLLRDRAAGDLVRECHGDLRAEHVVLDESLEIIDGVEFDPELRHIDVSADLAFLVMDLEALGRPELAGELEHEYRAAGGDPGPPQLLAFYAAYRAGVRAKVAALRAAQLSGQDGHAEAVAAARALLRLARRFSWRARLPLVLVLCGVSASGKSYLAERLAELSGLPHVSSDLVRKRLAGLAPTDRGGSPLYTDAVSDRTYRELGERAAAALGSHGGAIVDATCRRAAHRRALRGGLGEQAAPLVFVECVAPAGVRLDRARRRQADPARISDAGVEVIERQVLEWEPLDEIPPNRHLLLRTDRPAPESIGGLEALLDLALSGARAEPRATEEHPLSGA